MKVYSTPEEFPPPLLSADRLDLADLEKRETEYLERLTAHVKTLGYTGKNTGKIFHIPWADGAARYMVLEGPREFALMHLRLGDAWNVPTHMIRGLLKREVLAQVA